MKILPDATKLKNMSEHYTVITKHQTLICALNTLSLIESPNNNVVRARMLVEDEIQDSWEKIRALENIERDFMTVEQFEQVN